jgi:hypothetical protein
MQKLEEIRQIIDRRREVAVKKIDKDQWREEMRKNMIGIQIMKQMVVLHKVV